MSSQCLAASSVVDLLIASAVPRMRTARGMPASGLSLGSWCPIWLPGVGLRHSLHKASRCT
eukprot:1083886-Pyramimonas_sp.AAC.1